jgi:glycosyltransferase involved in cell wall biosynthesis
MVLPALSFFSIPFVFDPRGFWPEEKVDANHWSSAGLIYKVVKWLESLIYSRANCVFVQTKSAHTITSKRLSLLNSVARVEIIPNSVDLNLFDPLDHVSCHSEFILGYVGSLGTWYLLDEMLNVFAELKRRLPSSRFVIINKNQHELVFNRATALSVDTSSIDVISLSPLDVPKLVSTFDLAISLVKPCFSKLASSPTKIPEYLAMGVPVLSNSGVGDFESIFEANGVGITISTFDSCSISDAVSEAILLAKKPGIAYECRNVASNFFSLDHASLKMIDIFTLLLAERTSFL